MNRMRLRIAERLKDAQNTNAMLTTFNEIDMRLLYVTIVLILNICSISINVIVFFIAVSWNFVKHIKKASQRNMV